MQIRPAAISDIDGILPMVARICAFHEQQAPHKYPFLSHPEQRYHWWLTRIVETGNGVLLVAEVEGKLVGFTVATIEDEIPIYRVKRFGFVHDLWVELDYRRRGIGRALIGELVGRLRAMEVEQIRLDVLVNNESARKLCAACGFAPSTIEMLLPLREPARK